MDDAPIWTKFGDATLDEDLSGMAETEAMPLYPTRVSEDLSDSGSSVFDGIYGEILDMLEEDELASQSPVDEPPVAVPEDGVMVEEEPGLSTPPEVILPPSNRISVEFLESTLLTPRSCYEPFEPGVPIVKERDAIASLFEAAKLAGQSVELYTEFELDDFAIYCDRPNFPEEMRSLHQLDTKIGHSSFFFDGRLSVGDMAFFVRRVRIAAMPIDDYGVMSKHTVREKIWLKSDINASREIYYHLNEPAKEYRRFLMPFLWVADLAKHFVDYLKVMGEDNKDVTILHFRSGFIDWLSQMHGRAPEFVHWREQHPSEDFGTSIVANIGFLHKEAVGVLGYRATYKHSLWAEIWEFSRYRPLPGAETKTAPKKTRQLDMRGETPAGSSTDDVLKSAKQSHPSTVVTQYIYDCFSHLPFGDRLEAVPLSNQTETLRNTVIEKRNLEFSAPLHDKAKVLSDPETQQISEIRPGDTISTHRDAVDSGTKWRRDTPHSFHDVDRWFALVQRVHVDSRGRRSFDVIWYYRAVDTLCGLMKYPWNNELFLSDHCSCGESSKIREDEISGVHDVEVGGTSATEAEFFCRQTYIIEERKWVTLERDHLECPHTESTSATPKFRPGETRLVVINWQSGMSEPCEFITSYQENGVEIYRFRRLFRRSQIDADAASRPNELVYSEDIIETKIKHIGEPCRIRFFKPDTPIPTPYDRDGVGGFFYITHRRTYSDTRPCTPLETTSLSLEQSFDPSEPMPRLKGLDLFCGGGNLGRGLEDGGGIEMRWANDYDTKAMHTYMANTASPDAVSPFLGSIDDLQRLAIEGKFAPNVPSIGDVDFISGGSPCPGFSHLTNDKTTIAQRKNQSLVAAFGSFIDLYRPRYGLLENVPGIVQKRANRDQDVFSQLICAVVGLGYQTHFFFLDASSCGSPQRRSRVFLAFAAPGHRLPRRPDPTHAHPPTTKSLSLGNLPNGEPMTERFLPVATPFPFISARAATVDLPPVYDSKPDICIPFPDHRISVGLTKKLLAKMYLIPTQPWGMNFAQAWYGPNRKTPGSGVLTAAERLTFPAETNTSMSRTRPGSNAYGRQNPTRLIETIITGQSPSDAKNGRTLHWRENRVLTIMEARRAQGFRDHEVLLGSPSDQYRIVGNSVAREVAVALGSVFRTAWAESLQDERFRHNSASTDCSPVSPPTSQSMDHESPAVTSPSSTTSQGTRRRRSSAATAYSSKASRGREHSGREFRAHTRGTTTRPSPLGQDIVANHGGGDTLLS